MKWHLIFTGQAEDANDGDNIRQQGNGTLSILDEDGTTIAGYDAISGPGINGLLPNGKYNATQLSLDPNFPDEEGLSYKICLDPVGPLAIGFARSALRIHPVQHYWSGTVNGQKQYTTSPTDGCIGLVGNSNARPFLENMQLYFQQHNSIELEVNIIDNANVKIQLHDKLHYA